MGQIVQAFAELQNPPAMGRKEPRAPNDYG